MRITFFSWLDGLFKRKHKQNNYYQLLPIHRHVEIERGTIRHNCAVDSLMTIIDSIGDYDTFCDNGDLELFIEYIMRCNDNRKAIAKEELANRGFKY